jgi:nucleotide-binding universal stress UspA family protein
MRTIVVPLDGTKQSESALPWAHAIAARSGGSLHLAHVHIPFRVPTCQEVLGERVGQTLREIAEATREREADYLRDTRGRLQISHPTPEVSTALLRGPLRSALVDHAGEAGATLMVMATRPLRGLNRAWQGSVTDELVRRCPIPVLVVHGEEGPQPEPRVDRVLVPVDGSVAAEGAVSHAIALARLFEAELLFVRVVSPARSDGEAAERYLGGIEARVRPTGLTAESRVVVGRSVVEALTRTAKETGAGVIALTSRYRNRVPRLVFGNVAEGLVREGPCPILVVGERALRASGALSTQVVAWS